MDTDIRGSVSDIVGLSRTQRDPGEPAATYYHANCGGTTEDGRYILGSDEQRAPYLKLPRMLIAGAAPAANGAAG